VIATPAFLFSTMTCIRYEERPNGCGVADLLVSIQEGIDMEIRDFVIYDRNGERLINPPTKRHAGGFFNVIRIPTREDRTRFRSAVVSAIDQFRAGLSIADASNPQNDTMAKSAPAQ
jgi:hypothetical protein